MQAPIRTAGRYYRPELDVVRFLAFLFIFLRHAVPFVVAINFGPFIHASISACGFGIGLFFTLSAFLICELLLRERLATSTVAVKQFYIRRILRIWPLYYLGLALGFLLALPNGHHKDFIPLGWFAIFMGAWYCATHGAVASTTGPLWSVSVEEQFYLFAPWVIKHINRRFLYYFCLALILAANLCIYFFPNGSWYNPFAQFEYFSAGMLLCLALNGRLPRIALWQRLGLFAGCCSCWFFAFYRADENPGHWQDMGIIALGVLGSVLAIVAFLGVSPRLLPAWAIYLGRISYGLYVYHLYPTVIVMSFLSQNTPYALKTSPVSLLKAVLAIGSCLGGTIVIAVISYRFFETPFLRMKKRHTVIESQPIAGAADRS
jgi:peptidoglycan/LPS O-acetylase OafA/YrhL